jgi:hypothetical protein
MESLTQLNLIFRNLKWIIISSALISVLLFLPDQVRELYRVAADENGLGPLAIEYASILVIGIVVWFGTVSVIEATLISEKHEFGWLANYTVRFLPASLAALPILAAGLAQFLSRPELKNPVPLHVGSVIRIQAMSLEAVQYQLTARKRQASSCCPVQYQCG